MTGINIKYIVKTNSKLDSLQFYVRLVALRRGIKIPDNDVIILTYFMEYGFNKYTQDKLLEMGLLKDISCLRNSISRLRKSGWIIKNLEKPYGDKLCRELDVKLGDVNVLKILIDNR